MLIQLFRHGIAIDRTEPGCPPDAERFLTKRGQKRTKAAAKGMLMLGARADLVLSSPFLRARQTAEIVSAVLETECPTEVTDALGWDADPSGLRELLAARHGVESVLCAGHAPHLDLFVAHMVGAGLPFTELKKASLVTLECDFDEPGAATLVALFPPRVLRALGAFAE